MHLAYCTSTILYPSASNNNSSASNSASILFGINIFDGRLIDKMMMWAILCGLVAEE